MEERQRPLTFGTLKSLLGQLIARGRDPVLDTDLAGHYVNAAEMFVCTEVGVNAYWLEITDSLTATANNSIITLDPQIANIVSLRDEANIQPLSYLDRQRWNDYITTPSETTGIPLFWTKHGYVRRDNTESPTQHYGQLQIGVWPVPTGDTTLRGDFLLRPGHMVNDDDVPVLPLSLHWGLLQIAAWQAGAYDVGSKSYAQHKELAASWLATIKRDAVRHPGGNVRMIPRDDHSRRRMTAVITPPTRLGQLRGG